MKFRKPVKVTISDPDTGEEFESQIVSNNYVLITVGNRHLKSMQMWRGGTHILYVAVEKPEPIRTHEATP